MSELSEQRKYAIHLIKHPLNRNFYRGVIRLLKDTGVYSFGDPMPRETFTRQELVQLIEEAEKEAT